MPTALAAVACTRGCSIAALCILGSHKMKGIPRVITLEEPNLEGNISQLGGKCWHTSTVANNSLLNYKTSSMHSKHPCSQYSKETSLTISFSTRTEPTMNVELIVTFPVVQFMMSPKFGHVAYNTIAACDVILNSIALFTFLKGSLAINTLDTAFCWSVETISFIRRAWIDLWLLIFRVPSCFEPRQQNMMSGISNFWCQDSRTPALVLFWHLDLFIPDTPPSLKTSDSPIGILVVVRKNVHFWHNSHLSSTYWTHETLFASFASFLPLCHSRLVFANWTKICAPFEDNNVTAATELPWHHNDIIDCQDTSTLDHAYCTGGFYRWIHSAIRASPSGLMNIASCIRNKALVGMV